MDKEACKRFKHVWDAFPDTLGKSGNYQFKDEDFLNRQCDNGKCNSDNDRINAGCLYLLDQFYNDSSMFPSPKNNNRYIVDYILIWLSYMLNLNKNKKNNIDDFYNQQINSCDTYKTYISGLAGYDNYKELIDERKDLLYMNSNIVSKFYEAFKLFCNLNNELDDDKQDCKNHLENNNEFEKKYKELNEDTSVTKDAPYNKILFTLSTDYNNLKNGCKNILSSLSAETRESPGLTPGQFSADSYEHISVDNSEQISVDSSGQISEVTPSSSSIVSKIIPVLLIFGAISIFLGISYKVNNKELKNYFHYIYVNVNKKIIRFLTFYISIRYLDFGNDLQNNI
ncbi:hypothetical protein YYC_03859 [Plasmodium yoelii 17X]|uniref:Uncharacterized protein n=1 Tax=Plasmodium yoelii 17X TaxID=1323249 RepID=V7PIE5_PLAYE|nr:hypothetical protein YYC_03859 [Plasmodium yoelii 17X]